MLKSVAFQICSAVYLILLICVFVYKRKNKTFMSTIYEVMLFFSLLVLVLDILGNITIFFQNSYPLFTKTVNKSYLVSSIIWCMGLMTYILSIKSDVEYQSLKEIIKNEKLYIVALILTILACVVSILLESTFIVDSAKNVAYQSGPAIYFAFVSCFIYMVMMAIYMLYNPHKISFTQRIPIFVFLLLGIISIVAQWLFQSILLVSSVMSFVMLFIYFTMENPDMKIITELEHDKEEVEEASKAKTDFLSNMSHDIRTPMNAIIGFSESLLMEGLTEKQNDEVKNIYEAASTLLSIINNILDVSRIESGKEERNDSKYELRKIITQLTTMVTSKIDNEKLKFNIQLDKNVPNLLIGDSIKIYQILMNLLSNAVKYTEEGHIDFIITSENEADLAKIKFVVSDTGIGIKEKDFDKVFVKFQRIHNPDNYRSVEGTGLGLAITKELVAILGGTISFTSEYGKGTTFTVMLPQTICHDVEENIMLNLNNPATVGNVHFDGSLYDILIVDDNNLNLKVAERILSDYKFRIVTASSGDECIEKLKNGERYDLIFLDHMMPVKDGIQTLREIKSLEGIKKPPIVALTANAMVGMKETYLAEGFDGYISKPINRDELQVLLNNIFCQK